MELTKRKHSHTYVVIEDTTTRWGFVGFDPDIEILMIGTRKHCADWIMRNDADQNYCVISLEKYEELYHDTPESEEEENI